MVNKLSRWHVAGAAIAIGAALAAYWFFTAEPHPGQYDQSAKSYDLASDVELMWETKPLRHSGDPSHGENPHASTDRAINAASRVFNTMQLVGKSAEEVRQLLGDPRASNNSLYNFPFFPPQTRSMIYRFDSGMYGWQFDVVVGEDEVVDSVERHWIH